MLNSLFFSEIAWHYLNLRPLQPIRALADNKLYFNY